MALTLTPGVARDEVKASPVCTGIKVKRKLPKSKRDRDFYSGSASNKPTSTLHPPLCFSSTLYKITTLLQHDLLITTLLQHDLLITTRLEKGN